MVQINAGSFIRKETFYSNFIRNGVNQSNLVIGGTNLIGYMLALDDKTRILYQ